MSDQKAANVTSISTRSPGSAAPAGDTRQQPTGRAPVRFWRSLAELRGEPRNHPPRERFPLAEIPVSREQFLKLMGASLALAGLTGCAAEPKGPTHLAPYVRRPPGIAEGLSLYFATALTHKGYANGVLVRNVSGRPIKVEGNTLHPASLGATDIFSQAAMLTFYDPDRSRTITNKGQQKSWNDVVAALTTAASSLQARGGEGLRVLTETVTSPSLTDQIQTLLKRFPSAKWHQWEPVNRDSVREGARQAFGQVVETRYHLDQADLVVTLDADLLNGLPGSLRYARDFASKRRVSPTNPQQARLYAIESAPTITGAVADHRLGVRASDVEAIARAIASGVGAISAAATLPAGSVASWVAALVKDLIAHQGTSLVVAGDEQPPSVHVLAHQINQALGSVGRTVTYSDPVESNPVNQHQSLRELVQEMAAGKVSFLLILGGNPAYTAPADLDFASALAKVGESLHLSLYQDETSTLTTWHVPQAHELESWGDARAYDGTVTILQPLINPLYGGRTAQEILAVLNGQAASAHDLIKGFWQRQLNAADFEHRWRQILNDGVMPGTALPPRTVTLAATAPSSPPAAPPQGIEIVFRPDPTVYDGRFANNGWLQELPKPLTKVTWDNVVQVGPALAKQLGVQNEDVVEIQYRGHQVRGPVWVTPGQPDQSITVHLGYGRTRAGKVGTGRGFNAYLLRTSAAPWFDGGVEIRKTGERYTVATTQHTQDMEGREIVRAGTLEQYRQDPEFLKKTETKLVGSMYPPFPYYQYKWGMAIDLSACIGCSACAIACQAENNIPIVGKDQVNRGRQMHWIRVDRYFEGNAENPTSYAMPVPCMQCENAPCELVCPVAATTHSDDGLNDMVYNRCVGTRYCSNNCPYKVRRFNFYQYADYSTPSLQLLYNPDVTVRERGVMEKCTYCVQRIREAQIQADAEGRTLKDGEVVTACQAVCPTQAIVFGDLNDPNSKVAKLKASSLNYDLLAELNTRPRTSYLGAIRNPNPEIKVE